MADRTPAPLLRALEARDGRVCVWHGADSSSCRVEQLVPQHRQGGAGGRVGKHSLSNVVWLCSIMNGRIESEAWAQAEADHRGVAIPLDADPELSAIVHPVHGACLLLDDGGVVALRRPGHLEVVDERSSFTVLGLPFVPAEVVPW